MRPGTDGGIDDPPLGWVPWFGREEYRRVVRSLGRLTTRDSMGQPMTSVSELLSANLHEVFGNRDAEARRERIATIYTEDVVFTDPEGTVRGRSAVEEKAAGLLAGAPDNFVFAEDGERYVGSDIGALAWAFGPAEAPVARGIDVLTVANDHITSVRTFFIDTATR